MITINTLKILSDRKTMNVTVNAGTGLLVTSVKLWDEDTFKDYTVAVNLSDKLTQASEEEVFTILASDLGLTEFSGLYFLEFENNSTVPSTVVGLVAEVNEYEECKLDKILTLLYSGKDCTTDCNSGEVSEIMSIDAFLRGLEAAIAQGYIYESISLINALKKLCTNTCAECPPLVNLGSTSLEVIETCTRVAFNISTLTEDHCDTYPPTEHVALDNTAYHNGSNILPIVGDTVYSSSICTVNDVYTTGIYWTGSIHINIDASGIVQSNPVCP